MPIFSVYFIPFFHFSPIFWLVSLFLYFLPAFLARNKPNFTSILILNILAGWDLHRLDHRAGLGGFVGFATSSRNSCANHATCRQRKLLLHFLRATLPGRRAFLQFLRRCPAKRGSLRQSFLEMQRVT